MFSKPTRQPNTTVSSLYMKLLYIQQELPSDFNTHTISINHYHSSAFQQFPLLQRSRSTPSSHQYCSQYCWLVPQHPWSWRARTLYPGWHVTPPPRVECCREPKTPTTQGTPRWSSAALGAADPSWISSSWRCWTELGTQSASAASTAGTRLRRSALVEKTNSTAGLTSSGERNIKCFSK